MSFSRICPSIWKLKHRSNDKWEYEVMVLYDIKCIYSLWPSVRAQVPKMYDAKRMNSENLGQDVYINIFTFVHIFCISNQTIVCIRKNNMEREVSPCIWSNIESWFRLRGSKYSNKRAKRKGIHSTLFLVIINLCN